jgi:hypothetical protein
MGKMYAKRLAASGMNKSVQFTFSLRCRNTRTRSFSLTSVISHRICVCDRFERYEALKEEMKGACSLAQTLLAFISLIAAFALN